MPSMPGVFASLHASWIPTRWGVGCILNSIHPFQHDRVRPGFHPSIWIPSIFTLWVASCIPTRWGASWIHPSIHPFRFYLCVPIHWGISWIPSLHLSTLGCILDSNTVGSWHVCPAQRHCCMCSAHLMSGHVQDITHKCAHT